MAGAPTWWRCRAGGDITIVEIKSCLLDYQTDGKWQDYLEFCDRLYFAVNADFPCEVIPDQAGLILADRYGAELVREPVEERLSAARRKAMMLCFRPRRGAQAPAPPRSVLQLRGLSASATSGARLARMRCNVRRCMLSRRAVSETLRLHSS